jgi:hypothetical protein
MALEITFFQGIAGVIFASVAIIAAYYFQVARKFEAKTEEVTIKKSGLVEGDLLKLLFISSTLCTQKMLNFMREKMGEKKISKFLDKIPQEIQKVLRMPQDAVVNSVDDLPPFPEEIVQAVRLGDNERDGLFDLSFLGYALRELVPETVSEQVDKLIKAIICGVILGLLVPALDYFFSQNWGQNSFLFTFVVGVTTGAIAVTGFYYVKDGILGLWSMRKLEKKIKKLDRDRNTDEIRDTIEEIL